MVTDSLKNNHDKVKTKCETTNNPEINSEFVRVSHKISSINNQSQVVKLGGKYYRVKELG